MTNRERYLRAFSALQPSADWVDQLEAVQPKKAKRHGRRLIAALVAAILVVGLIGVAYAADLGGIQARVRIWYLGKLVHMDVAPGWIEDCSSGAMVPTYVFCNEDGEEVFRLPAREVEGKTEEELIAALSDNVHLYVNEAVDGTPIVHIYYFDQSIDIGSYFDENGYGRYAGEISAGDHRQWVEVWRTEEEPWWHLRNDRLD